MIIPCYRQAHFLSEAVDSALGQSYPKIQVVVVNDGSDDNTQEVARRYGNAICYVHQDNRGLSAARNAGIRVANGRYLLFLDADDLLHVDAVTWLVQAVQGKSQVLALMGYVHFERNGTDRYGPPRHPRVECLLPELIRHTLAPPVSWLFPADSVREIGGFEESTGGLADWDLQLRLALGGCSLATVDSVGAYYRQYPGQMSRQLPLMFFDRQRVTLRLHERIMGSDLLLRHWGQELLKLEYKILRQSIALQLRNGDRERLLKAMEELRCAGFTIPAGIPKRVLERAFGARAELVAFNLSRFLRPSHFRKYRRS